MSKFLVEIEKARQQGAIEVSRNAAVDIIRTAFFTSISLRGMVRKDVLRCCRRSY